MVRRPCLTPLVLINTSAILRTSPDRPRTTSTYELRPEQVANKSRLLWLPPGLVLLFFTGLGLGIWAVRRR